ncbi:MAG: TonB-dependent receptor [Candidatus Aminicenantales bacterium]|jgi:vitamin B12 transporter
MVQRAPAFAVLMLACGLIAGAEEEQVKPPPPLQYDVVVTATKVETPSREVASSVTVITEADLARTRKSTVLDALEDLIGLSVTQNGGPGAAASVFIRGAGSEDTLVLLDGVELNDPINPSRSYDLAHLALSQVARIEVLRGPQSPLYGSDAMGGVINIITRRGQGRPRLDLSSSAGSYGTWTSVLGFSGAAGRSDYSFGLSYARTAGFSAASDRYAGNSEPDGYRNLTLSGRFGFAVRKNIDLDVMVRSISARSAIDDFGGPYGDDPNAIQDYAATLARIQARGLFLGNRWEQKLSISWTRSDRKLINPPDDAHPLEGEDGTYAGQLIKLDWQNNFFLGPSQTLTAGVELGQEAGHSDYISTGTAGTDESSFPSQKAGAGGFYIQDQWKAGGSFFLAAGARLDVHSRTGAALTFRLAPAWVIKATGTKLKATLGTGFKSPSLYQLFAPPTTWGPIGNINLQPERVTGWDAGAEQDIVRDRLRLGVTYFRNSFRDLIDFDYLQGYINVGRAGTHGIEVSLESRPLGPGESLSLRASYTRLIARDEATGEALLRRPRDKFSAEVGSRLFRRVDLSASLLFVGKRMDRDFSVYPYQDIPLASYALLGAVISTPVSRALDLYVRLDNILNARYEMVWGYGTPAFSFVAGLRLIL